ncbi:uncharacterized protein V1516DRAFT_680496 [Lipomyces oligophaga]|uniref:uncharacterized protein n=1 Tax=Lipomyces oligophaga TaxID=45792 RepID=UPI0034CE60AC
MAGRRTDAINLSDSESGLDPNLDQNLVRRPKRRRVSHRLEIQSDDTNDTNEINLSTEAPSTEVNNESVIVISDAEGDAEDDIDETEDAVSLLRTEPLLHQPVPLPVPIPRAVNNSFMLFHTDDEYDSAEEDDEDDEFFPSPSQSEYEFIEDGAGDEELRELFYDSTVDQLLDNPTTHEWTSSAAELREKAIQSVNPSAAKPEESSTLLSAFTCVICYDQPENIAATPCGHLYCIDCLYRALAASSTATATSGECSICRRKVFYKNIIPLELRVDDDYTDVNGMDSGEGHIDNDDTITT